MELEAGRRGWQRLICHREVAYRFSVQWLLSDIEILLRSDAQDGGFEQMMALRVPFQGDIQPCRNRDLSF
jgi:hypothetical protein